MHPYILRHSGPSDDHIRGHRSLDEIRRRGRWAVESSAKRYTKADRTLAQMQQWSAESKKYMREAEGLIGDVLLRRRFAVPFSPPAKWGAISQRCPQVLRPSFSSRFFRAQGT